MTHDTPLSPGPISHPALPGDAPASPAAAAGPQRAAPAQAGPAGRTSSGLWAAHTPSSPAALRGFLSSELACSCPGPGVMCDQAECLSVVSPTCHQSASTLTQDTSLASQGSHSPRVAPRVWLDVTFSALWITLTTRTGPERPEPEPESPLGPTLSKKAKKVGCDRAEGDQSGITVYSAAPAVTGLSITQSAREDTAHHTIITPPSDLVVLWTVTSEGYIGSCWHRVSHPCSPRSPGCALDTGLHVTGWHWADKAPVLVIVTPTHSCDRILASAESQTVLWSLIADTKAQCHSVSVKNWGVTVHCSWYQSDYTKSSDKSHTNSKHSEVRSRSECQGDGVWWWTKLKFEWSADIGKIKLSSSRTKSG